VHPFGFGFVWCVVGAADEEVEVRDSQKWREEFSYKFLREDKI